MNNLKGAKCLVKAEIITKNDTTLTGTVYGFYDRKENKKLIFKSQCGYDFIGTNYTIMDPNSAPTNLDVVIVLTKDGPRKFIFIQNSYNKKDECVQSAIRYNGGF